MSKRRDRGGSVKNESGLSLIEVMIAMTLLIIVSAGFMAVYATNYLTLHRGKDITADTFKGQEEMENIIREAKDDDDLPVASYTLFSGTDDEREVSGKLIEIELAESRLFFTFISDEEIQTPRAPQIDNVVVKAYDNGGNETYPWVGSELRVTYDDSDELIFGKIHRWYESGLDDDNNFILNPTPPADFDLVKIEDGGDDEHGRKLEEYYTVNEGRYIYYGVTPYSNIGKMGSQAKTPFQQLLIMDYPEDNPYWGDYIEQVYLYQYGGDSDLIVRQDFDDIYIYTNLNQERLTLNVETQATDKSYREGSFIYAKIPDGFRKQTDPDFSITLDAMVDPQTHNHEEVYEIGYGIFIGDLAADGTGKEVKGHMLEFDAKQDRIVLKKITGVGNYSEVTTKDVPSGNFWTETHEIVINIIRKEGNVEGRLEVQFLKDNEPINEEFIVFDDDSMDVVGPTSYLGFKTWSDLEHIDETYEIQVGKRAMSAHFYGVEFKELEE